MVRLSIHGVVGVLITVLTPSITFFACGGSVSYEVSAHGSMESSSGILRGEREGRTAQADHEGKASDIAGIIPGLSAAQDEAPEPAQCIGNSSAGSETTGTCSNACKVRNFFGVSFKRPWCYLETSADWGAGTLPWCWCSDISALAPPADAAMAFGASLMAHMAAEEDGTLKSTAAGAMLTFKLYCLAATQVSVKIEVYFPNDVEKSLTLSLDGGVWHEFAGDEMFAPVNETNWTKESDPRLAQRGVSAIHVLFQQPGVTFKNIGIFKGHPTCSLRKSPYSWKLLLHQPLPVGVTELSSSIRQSFKNNENWNETESSPYVSIGSLKIGGFKEWHLAPAGASTCDSGTVASQGDCDAIVRRLASLSGNSPARNLQVGSGGNCSIAAEWGLVPLGCSAQSGGDWAAHYKTSGSNCGSIGHQLVCSGKANPTATDTTRQDDLAPNFQGKYHFRAKYHEDTIEWKQSNWLSESSVTGFECVQPTDCNKSELSFSGLARSSDEGRLLDGDGSGDGTDWTAGLLTGTNGSLAKDLPVCNGDDSGGVSVVNASCNSICAKTVNALAYSKPWCYTTADRSLDTDEWCWCDRRIVSLWVAYSVTRIRGPEGQTGIAGVVGPEGPQGPVGDTGNPGEDGNNGSQGKQGPAGLIGHKGEKGFSKSSKMAPDLPSAQMVYGIALFNLVCMLFIRFSAAGMTKSKAKKESQTELEEGEEGEEADEWWQEEEEEEGEGEEHQ